EKEAASAIASIGLSKMSMGMYPEAHAHFFKSLRVAEKIKDTNFMAGTLCNIALTYSYQNDEKQAIPFFLKAISLKEILKNTENDHYGNMLNGLGISYDKLKKSEDALTCFRKALNVFKKIKDNNGEAMVYGGIGNAQHELKRLDSAEFYFRKGIEMHEKQNNRSGIAGGYINLGRVLLEQKKFALAKNFIGRGLELAHSAERTDYCLTGYEYLSDLYQQQGDYKNALASYKTYIQYRDSLFNDENTKQTVQHHMQFEFDKKSSADSIKNSEAKKFEEIKHQQEISKQKTFTWAGIGGFVIMIIIAVISFIAFRNKKKANIEIAKQKDLVEEKQKEILDSIYYARRIQRALLTSEKYIERNLSFLKKN
ncbi:MAG: tetratricopeptide repeat protein, partial [Bacteroidia bacterium]|nr:tetratricopeptide repeat protein [Bacteroidia bacterium]